VIQEILDGMGEQGEDGELFDPDGEIPDKRADKANDKNMPT
jgi:hypothetical protein